MSIGAPGLSIGKVRAYLSKNASVAIILGFFTVNAVMQLYVQFNNMNQFIPNWDAWFMMLNWTVTVPAIVLWIRAEVQKQYFMQVGMGILFILCGPALLVGIALRQHSCFSFWEGEILFGTTIIGGIIFVVSYLHVKFR